MHKIFKKGKKTLIAYITAGDPNLTSTSKIISKLIENGVDLIELGIPFSDSLADGPTIVASHLRSLKNGTSLKSVFKFLESIKAPIMLMLSYNLVYNFGLENFQERVKSLGLLGYIIPDLPKEETNNSLTPTYLIAPTTAKNRIKSIANASKHFIYLVSSTGVTGVRQELPKDILENYQKIRAITKKPIAIGFGISTIQQAKDICNFADGIIVGSALVDLLKQDEKKAYKFVQELRLAIDNL